MTEFHHFLQPRVCKYEVVVVARYQGQGIAVVGHVAYEHRCRRAVETAGDVEIRESGKSNDPTHPKEHIQHASSERWSHVVRTRFWREKSLENRASKAIVLARSPNLFTRNLGVIPL